MSDFELKEYNRVSVNITNPSEFDAIIVGLQTTWEFAELWGEVLGYDDIRVDWFSWDGVRINEADDYTSPTYRPVNLQLPAGSMSTWEIDFDFGGEEIWSFRDKFGLIHENFGFMVVFGTGEMLMRTEIISYPPEPDCTAYTIGDFYFGNYAHVLVDLANNDLLYNTNITQIEFDWGYAESFDTLADPNDDLNIDYLRYGGRDTWGNFDGAERDYDSPTNTSLDSPDTFPSQWSSYDLPPFESGQTYTLDIDFDDEWLNFPDGLRSEDFGVTFTFENGCSLTKSAVPRPLPTPNCEAFSASTFTVLTGNQITTTISNNDIYPTEIERIIFNWDRAETIARSILRPNNLYLDWFAWDSYSIWSNSIDTIRDFTSVTDTNLDSPFGWYGPVDIFAQDTIKFEVDFDFARTPEDENTFLNWGLTSDDFGAKFHFSNGCVLVLPVVE